MEWVNSRDDVDLLPDLARPSPPPTDFSPFVSGLLAPSAPAPPPPTTEWPVPHAASRSARNDFYYEFSISAGPEFDTDSAQDDDPDRHEEDNVSADWRGAATASEDTSLGAADSAAAAAAAAAAAVASAKSGSAPSSSAPLPNDPSVNSSAAASTPTKSEDMMPATSPPPPSSSTPALPARAVPPAPALSPGPSLKPGRRISKKKGPTTPKAGAASPRVSSATVGASGSGTAITQTVSASAATGNSVGGNAALSHTKLCRDRLNNMFERLRHTLPPAPAGVEVKHKAQVLDYAIMVLKGMVDRTSQLEIELAVSSNKATMDWISKLVNRVDSFPRAAEEVMRLFTKRRAWMHAELWVAGKRPVEPTADPEDAVLLTFRTSVRNDGMADMGLQNFSKESESYAFRAREGVQGRVWSSMRPEWVTGLSDPKNFQRAALARKYGLKVCLAVPITITGKIEGVMCFYDVKHRPYDMQCLELAMRLAWALGNAIGGKRAKVNYLTTSGTSST